MGLGKTFLLGCDCTKRPIPDCWSCRDHAYLCSAQQQEHSIGPDVLQVGQVREVEVRAARGEGVHEARQLADREHARLQQDHQERLQQLQAQEQQVCTC